MIENEMQYNTIKSIIGDLESNGVNKKNSCNSFTTFCKKRKADIYHLKDMINEPCEVSNGAIWFVNYPWMYIELNSKEIKFNY